jgi:hypothetical protein
LILSLFLCGFASLMAVSPKNENDTTSVEFNLSSEVRDGHPDEGVFLF